MNIPTSQPIPEETEPLSAARRRRERRLPIPPAGASQDERAAFVDHLAERAIPSFDYFLFSLLAGWVMGAGLLVDAPALIVLGAVLAPLSGPILGLGVACMAGSGRFFLRSLATAAIGALLALGGGFLAGYGGRFIPGLPASLTQANAAAQFSWPVLASLSLGVILTTIAFARSSQKAQLTGAVVTYLLFPPVVCVGFGLANGAAGLWPQGAIVFGAYLAWSIILCALTLGMLGLRPLTGVGFALGACIAIASLAVLIGLGSIRMAQNGVRTLPQVQPTAKRTQAAVSAPDPTHAAAVTSTPRPSATHTLIPSLTPTITFTPAPTPVWAIVNAATFNGAFIREEPIFGSKILVSVLNGTLIEVLPDTVLQAGTLWARVRTSDGREGWIVQNLLVTATPVPGW
ncbi:MAG TPA: DUF389 domain-containing protein [Anaerolineaceae bacterium]|jgi:hypothetical protein